MENALVDITTSNPIIAVIIALAIITVGAFLLWKKYFSNEKNCLNCDVKKDRDFYMRTAERQNTDVTFLVETTKEIRGDLEAQKIINKEMLQAITEVNTNMKLNNQALMMMLNKK